MKKIISFAVLFSPVLAFAQATPVTDFNSVTSRFLNILNVIIYVLVALAVVFIVYNVVMYVIKGGDAAGKTEAMKNIGWGLVGLAIIVSVWGLVGILTRTVKTVPDQQAIPNVSNSTSVGGLPGNQIPQVP